MLSTAVVVLVISIACLLCGCGSSERPSAEYSQPTVVSYGYDAHGNCTREEWRVPGDDSWFLLYERSYTDEGVLESETEYSGGDRGRGLATEYSYGKDGKLAEKARFKTGTSSEGSRSVTTYEYDEVDGLERVVETSGGDGGAGVARWYSGGLLVREADVRYADGRFEEVAVRRECEYDGAGNLLAEKAPGLEKTYEYDGSGRCVEVVAKDLTGNVSYTCERMGYDGSGRLVRKDTLDRAGEVASYSTYRYDDAGRLVQMGSDYEV